MSLLEIVLAFISLLYGVILYRILVNNEATTKTIKSVYEDLIGHLENLRQRHNSLVDNQREFTETSIEWLLAEVNKKLEDAHNRHLKNNERVLEELELVKKYLSQFFLRK